MATLKQQLVEVVSSLPDDCTMDDFRYRLYVRQRIEEGLRDVEAGSVYSHDEAVEMVKSWRKSSGPNPPLPISEESTTTLPEARSPSS